MPSSPIKSPVSAKKICLEIDLNNSLNAAEIEIEGRICGVLNLASLFKHKYINVPTKDLITIAYDIDLSCSQECLEQIEMKSRHRLFNDKESKWKQIRVGRICGSVFKDGKIIVLFNKLLDVDIKKKLFTKTSVSLRKEISVQTLDEPHISTE